MIIIIQCWNKHLEDHEGHKKGIVALRSWLGRALKISYSNNNNTLLSKAIYRTYIFLNEQKQY